MPTHVYAPVHPHCPNMSVIPKVEYTTLWVSQKLGGFIFAFSKFHTLWSESHQHIFVSGEKIWIVSFRCYDIISGWLVTHLNHHPSCAWYSVDWRSSQYFIGITNWQAWLGMMFQVSGVSGEERSARRSFSCVSRTESTWVVITVEANSSLPRRWRQSCSRFRIVARIASKVQTADGGFQIESDGGGPASPSQSVCEI